jgi:hypothetical protein
MIILICSTASRFASAQADSDVAVTVHEPGDHGAPVADGHGCCGGLFVVDGQYRAARVDRVGDLLS